MNLSANNPAVLVETRVAPPGTELMEFNTNTQMELLARYAQILAAAQVEPFPVNYSETGQVLGGVNYEPYTPCQ